MTIGHALLDDDAGMAWLTLLDSIGTSRNTKARAQRDRPMTMIGIERRRMRRRPIRSIEWNATRVKRKLVEAMEREVKVGERKPTREKIVAEKYIREFCVYFALAHAFPPVRKE